MKYNNRKERVRCKIEKDLTLQEFTKIIRSEELAHSVSPNKQISFRKMLFILRRMKKQHGGDVTRDEYYKTCVSEKLPFAPFPVRGGYNATIDILRGENTQRIVNDPESWKF